MNLNDLQALGAYAENARAVKKTISWEGPDGNTLNGEIQIRRLSVADNERLSKRAEEKNIVYGAVLISELVLFDGERITYENALRLDEVFAKALVDAIVEVRTPEKN